MYLVLILSILVATIPQTQKKSVAAKPAAKQQKPAQKPANPAQKPAATANTPAKNPAPKAVPKPDYGTPITVTVVDNKFVIKQGSTTTVKQPPPKPSADWSTARLGTLPVKVTATGVASIVGLGGLIAGKPPKMVETLRLVARLQAAEAVAAEGLALVP